MALEVFSMDLKNNQITVREILSNPQAVALFHRELPALASSPMLRMSQSLTLESLLRLAKGNLPSQQIQRILKDLQEI